MTCCILCGGNRFRPVYQDDRVEIVRCVSCGLVRQADYTRSLSKLSEEYESIEQYYQMVDVPSFNNPRIIAYRLTRIASLVQRDFIPSHCHYFTRRTLSQLVEKAGFRVLKAKTGRYSVKFSENILTNALDWLANALGIGGITLYVRKA